MTTKTKNIRVTFEQIQKEKQEKIKELQSQERELEEKIDNTDKRILSKENERQKAEEALEIDLYTSLEIELSSLYKAKSMLENKLKQCRAALANPALLLSDGQLEQLHGYIEDENLKLLLEYEKHIEAIESLIEKSKGFVEEYESMAKEFYKDDDHTYLFRAPWEYKGYDLLGINLVPLKTRIETAREKGKI